jgi:DNA-directed RNA polymerase subunit K/omega
MAIDYKKSNAPLNTSVHDLIDLAEQTGNIYETVAIIGKRANQISADMKNDLEKKLQEFTEKTDNLEEISENREQIEISKYYEKLPKSTLIATKEYEEGKLYFRNVSKEKDEIDF